MEDSSKMSIKVRRLLIGLWVTMVLVVVCGGQAAPAYSRSSVVLYDDDGSIRGFHSPYNESDFFLGVLARIHWKRCEEGEQGVLCNESFSNTGLESVEAILFALDTINNDTALLPNVTLGYDVRDTCNSEVVAIDHSLPWIPGSVTDETCLDEAQEEVPSAKLAGVIGATSSSVSVPVAGFFRVFAVPQISYASTSPRLSDRDRYPYFFRTVPSDTSQARAMLDLVREFGWTIVTTVHSNDDYGELGISAFRLLAAENNICVDLDEGLDEDFEDRDYSRVAMLLVTNSTADVIVLFTLENHARRLFQSIQDFNTTRRFTWIGSDGWAQIASIHEDFREILVGMFGVAPASQVYADFNAYYEQITPATNARDPWFRDYCSALLSGRGGRCTDNSSIAQDQAFVPSPSLPFAVDAVYSFAHALHNLLSKNCHAPVAWNRTAQSCEGQNGSLDGSTLLKELKDLSFVSPTSNLVEFDEQGNGKAGYEIANLRRDGQMKRIAQWDWSSMLKFFVPKSELQFGLTVEGEVITERVSECTICKPGSARLFVPSSCCTHCSPCLGNLYVNGSSPGQCSQCEENEWGNDPLNGSTGCVPIEEVYLQSTDPWGITLLVLQILGIVVVTVIVVGLGIFWKDPVIKSFGREQLILVFVGVAACFLLPVFYLLKPSVGTCTMKEIVLWFSLSLIFSALLVKLVRVTRIFLAQPTAKGRTRFIGPWYQVLFTFVLVAVQMVLVVISFIVASPGAKYDLQKNTEDTNDFPLLVITCTSTHTALLILQIVYESMLIIVINGLAIFTIRFPENFNESKYIAFSTFSIGVVWMGFIPTYFATQNDPRLQSATIALAVMMMAFSVIICLILPRLYISTKTKLTTFTSDHPKNTMAINSPTPTVSSGL